mmetsp:Transcript_24542/g.70843  ORF Transcript_24542/g.70843 Transcript_24542/m.70843 type:complete len:223 (-) Transcript_24542:239-907(-)
MVARVVLYLICVITIVFRCLAQVAESEAVEGFTHVGFGVCASGGEPSDFYSPIVEEGVVTSLGSVREQLAALGIPVAECARLCSNLTTDLGVCEGIQHDTTTDSCLVILNEKPDGTMGGEANECFRFVDGSFESVGTGSCRVESEEGIMIIGPHYTLHESPGTNITAEYCFEYCLRMNEEEGAISTQTNQPFCTGVEVRDLCELQVVMAPTTASLSVCYAKN